MYILTRSMLRGRFAPGNSWDVLSPVFCVRGLGRYLTTQDRLLMGPGIRTGCRSRGSVPKVSTQSGFTGSVQVRTGGLEKRMKNKHQDQNRGCPQSHKRDSKPLEPQRSRLLMQALLHPLAAQGLILPGGHDDQSMMAEVDDLCLLYTSDAADE